MPEMDASGRSSTRKAARLAVYEATMIIAKPAQTMPSTRALKLRGVPARQQTTTYTCIYMYMCICMYINMYIYTQMYMYNHAYLQFYIMHVHCTLCHT